METQWFDTCGGLTGYQFLLCGSAAPRPHFFVSSRALEAKEGRVVQSSAQAFNPFRWLGTVFHSSNADWPRRLSDDVRTVSKVASTFYQSAIFVVLRLLFFYNSFLRPFCYTVFICIRLCAVASFSHCSNYTYTSGLATGFVRKDWYLFDGVDCRHHGSKATRLVRSLLYLAASACAL